jgi:hypothetical protein
MALLQARDVNVAWHRSLEVDSGHVVRVKHAHEFRKVNVSIL